MELTVYQVDAFTRERFRGNPAAVIPLEDWLDDALLQNIALENNLSETVYFVAREGRYEIRWFTPQVEVPLCGHATLASAWVLFNILQYPKDSICFDSASGELVVSRSSAGLVMDFPAHPPQPALVNSTVADALGANPVEVHSGFMHLYVYESEAQLRNLRPDFNALVAADTNPYICTAPGEEVDFVSRFFAPGKGVPEDPVTGSAHTVLTPYWAARLGRTRLHARQVSARGGDLQCELRGDRVQLTGNCVLFMQGTIQL